MPLDPTLHPEWTKADYERATAAFGTIWDEIVWLADHGVTSDEIMALIERAGVAGI